MQVCHQLQVHQRVSYSADIALDSDDGLFPCAEYPDQICLQVQTVLEESKSKIRILNLVRRNYICTLLMSRNLNSDTIV
jgi:hypothetical protein